MAHRSALLASFVLTSFASGALAQGAPKGGEVLTNQTVIQMVMAKLGTDVIMAKIQSTKSDFDVTAAGLVSLHTNKVPRDVMKSMISTKPSKPSTEVLTNESIIQMVTSKLPRDVILVKIQSTKRKFDTTSDGLVSLNTNKVPKDIIKAMMVSSS